MIGPVCAHCDEHGIRAPGRPSLLDFEHTGQPVSVVICTDPWFTTSKYITQNVRYILHLTLMSDSGHNVCIWVCACMYKLKRKTDTMIPTLIRKYTWMFLFLFVHRKN